MPEGVRTPQECGSSKRLAAGSFVFRWQFCIVYNLVNCPHAIFYLCMGSAFDDFPLDWRQIVEVIRVYIDEVGQR